MKEICTRKACEIYQLSLGMPTDGKYDLVFFKELNENGFIKIILTSDIENYVTWVDRKNAIFKLIAQSGVPKEIAFEEWEKEVLSSEISCQANKRKRQYKKGKNFIIFEYNQNVRIDLNEENIETFGPLIVETEFVQEPPPKTSLIEDEKNRFFTAINLLNEDIIEYNFIIKGSEYYKDDGTKILRKRVSMGGGEAHRLCNITQLDKEKIEELNSIWQNLQEKKFFGRGYNLLASSASSSQEMFKRFIDAWSALEILTNKLSDLYKEEVVNELIRTTQRRSEKVLLDKVKNYLKDESRFGLLERFSFIVEILFEEPIDLINKFKNYKKIRDKLFHGSSVDIRDNELPSLKVSDLTLTILKRHLYISAID